MASNSIAGHQARIDAAIQALAIVIVQKAHELTNEEDLPDSMEDERTLARTQLKELVTDSNRVSDRYRFPCDF